MASSISAARSALYDLLVTAAAGVGALSGVQISWGDPLAYEEQEVVALGGTADVDSTLATFDGDLDESFGIVVRVKVHDPAGDAETVDIRGYALADAVGDVVIANPTLSSAVWSAVPNGGRSEFGAQGVADAPGWVIFIDVTVTCAVG